MKRYFLSYNELTKDYYLDYGCFDRQRKFLGKIKGDGLIEKLKEILPLHRQIIIYSNGGINNSVKELLLETFENTSIDVQFKKDLKSKLRI